MTPTRDLDRHTRHGANGASHDRIGDLRMAFAPEELA